MNCLIILSVLILIELVLLYVSSKNAYENYEITPQNDNKNNEPIIAKNEITIYKKFSEVDESLTTCQRCKGDI